MNKKQTPPLLVVTTDSTQPWDNLAMEEYLMDLSLSDSDPAPGRRFSAILYLWQNRHTVVIGRNQNAWAECRTSLLEEEGGFLARRSTGGGAVYHDLGNLNFSFISPRSRFDLGRSFDVILDAVRSLGIEAVRSGRNDLLLGDRKFSGNAFRYLRGVALHHGTLMVDTDVEPMLRYLTVARAKLQSRAIQSVRSRVVNLIEAKSDLTVPSLSQAVIASFVSAYGAGADVQALAASQVERDGRLAELEALYASWQWRYGRAVDFDIRIETGRFDWGQAELLLKVEEGRITDALFYSDALDSDLIHGLAHSLRGTRFHGDEIADRILRLGQAADTVGSIPGEKITADLAAVIRSHSF
ncbi:MAG: lipoate--protein ligase [Saccharofermentanales bacterium]